MTASNSDFKNQLEASLNQALQRNQNGSMVRRPQEAPPPIPPRRNKVNNQTGKAPTPPQKRRLMLPIPVETANAPAVTNGFGTCKSPKIQTPGSSRVWSPAICTICMEDLFAYSEEPTTSSQSAHFYSSGTSHSHVRVEETMRPILSTRCGHLFHTECINKWFVEKQEKEIKECPFCKREMMANDTTRIFPIFDND